MVVHVKKDSESGDTIATLNINANALVKHVKEQIEVTTGIRKATQCLFFWKRLDKGNGEKLWQLHDVGKVSNYYIKDGSTLVLRPKVEPLPTTTGQRCRCTGVCSCGAVQLKVIQKNDKKAKTREAMCRAQQCRRAREAMCRRTGARSSQ